MCTASAAGQSEPGGASLSSAKILEYRHVHHFIRHPSSSSSSIKSLPSDGLQKGSFGRAQGRVLSEQRFIEKTADYEAHAGIDARSLQRSLWMRLRRMQWMRLRRMQLVRCWMCGLEVSSWADENFSSAQLHRSVWSQVCFARRACGCGCALNPRLRKDN